MLIVEGCGSASCKYIVFLGVRAWSPTHTNALAALPVQNSSTFRAFVARVSTWNASPDPCDKTTAPDQASFGVCAHTRWMRTCAGCLGCPHDTPSRHRHETLLQWSARSPGASRLPGSPPLTCLLELDEPCAAQPPTPSHFHAGLPACPAMRALLLVVALLGLLTRAQASGQWRSYQTQLGVALCACIAYAVHLAARPEALTCFGNDRFLDPSTHCRRRPTLPPAVVYAPIPMPAALVDFAL